MDILKKYYSLILFLVLGLIVFFYPVLFINQGLMPGDLGDARFINYLLEHSYLYTIGDKLHASFWDMPILWPYKNTLAYSDVMLGGMILYVPLRFLIKSPQTTLQVWLFVVCVLNYLSGYLFLKKICKSSVLISSFGAYLFAFCLIRYAQISHLQLYCQFLMMFSLLFFFSIKKENSKIKNHLYFALSSVFFALELWTSFYYGWFMVFCAMLLVMVALCIKNYRTKVFDFIRNFWFEIILYGILTVLLVLPLVSHYLAVGGELRFNPKWLIKIQDFFYSESFLDSFITRFRPNFECEKFIGLGFLTTGVLFISLIKSKDKKLFIPFILICLLFFSSKILYAILYVLFPGASAIRAASRVVISILPLYIVLICAYLSEIKTKWILWLVIALVAIEQIPNQSNYLWTKQEHIQRLKVYEVPKYCDVIYYMARGKAPWKRELDIMWMASEKGIYTRNGYSGYVPKFETMDDLKPGCFFKIVDR